MHDISNGKTVKYNLTLQSVKYNFPKQLAS